MKILNLNKTLNQAKVLFTTDQKFFRAQVTHSPCSQALRGKKSWEISKSEIGSEAFGGFLFRPKHQHSEEIQLGQWKSKDSYFYVSYVLRDKVDNRVIAYDYGYFLLLRPPPIANITGVTRAIKGQGIVILDASAALHSKGHIARLKFRWFCRRKGERFSNDDSHFVNGPNGNSNTSGGCYGYGPGRLRGHKRHLRVNVDKMAAGQTYVFTVEVELRSKTSTDDHYLTVMAPTNFTVRWVEKSLFTVKTHKSNVSKTYPDLAEHITKILINDVLHKAESEKYGSALGETRGPGNIMGSTGLFRGSVICKRT